MMTRMKCRLIFLIWWCSVLMVLVESSSNREMRWRERRDKENKVEEEETGQVTVVTSHGVPVKENLPETGEDEEYHEHTDAMLAMIQKSMEANMELTTDERGVLKGMRRRKRFMTNNKERAWPKGIVPFEFDMEKLSEQLRREALAAMNRFHKYTCIRFVPWVENKTKEQYGLPDEGHVLITKGDGCVAVQGNVHSKRGQYNSCCFRFTCTHQLGHTLGLWHEHQSPWREDFVKLDIHRHPEVELQWANNMRYLVDMVIHQYDVTSTMHYGSKMFQIMYEDLKAIKAMRNQFYMYKDVSLFYECQKLHCPDFTTKCHNTGFATLVDDQCSCLCPPGLDPATGCSTTIKQAINSAQWPSGSFALFSIGSGCPGGEFQEGSWQHKGQGQNKKSDDFHLAGSFDADIFRYKFCVKEDNSQSSAAPEWEPGRYCILRVNGHCPAGFEPGSIQFDDAPDSTGQPEGRLPDGQFVDNKDTRLDFCCRDDGFSSFPLTNIPNTQYFVLLPNQHTKTCQSVAGMRWIKEYMRFDSFPDNASVSGSHPYIYENTQFQIALCLYGPVNLNCGGDVILTKSNPTATITSPDFPRPYIPDGECNWLIKADESGGHVLLNFDVMKLTSNGNDCMDSLEIRYNLPGQPGIRYCGDGFARTVRSLHDTVILTLRTDNAMFATDIGFQLNASLYLENEDGCYDPATRGRLYRGQKDYTRGMKPCLPWTEVTQCADHAFHPKDFGLGLDKNYCRNPDNTPMPWCYIDHDCNRDFCDVCNIERVYDRSASCNSSVCEKSREEIISKGCAATCHLSPPAAPDRDTMCGEPVVPPDAIVLGILAAGDRHPVGQTVTLQCKTGSERINITCLSHGRWSSTAFVCGACDDGWAFKDGACYKYFKVGVSALYGPGDDVVELTPSNFHNKVINGDELWLVEFYAPWCGHCKSLAPEWKKAATALKGIIKMGVVNADEHNGLGSQYEVRGFPTIKFFGMDKFKPQDYQGQRTASGIVDFCMSQAKSTVNARLSGKKSGGSKSGGGGSGKAGDPADVVEVTDSNFDEEVLEHDGLVMVEFYAPWCGHCKNLAPHWAQAATELKGKVKLCALDATVHTVMSNRYGVRGFPTIKVFPAGKKDGEAEEYDGGRTANDIVQWAMEKAAANIPPPEVYEIISGEVLKDNCEGHQLCIISVLPHILDCQSQCRNDYLRILRTLGEKFKKNQWGWLWAEAGAQLALEDSLEVGGFGYPALAAVNSRKMKFSLLRGQFSEKGINEFLRDLSYGKGSTSPLKNAELPKIETREAWDGKDGELPVEEDIDLSDMDLDEGKDEL